MYNESAEKWLWSGLLIELKGTNVKSPEVSNKINSAPLSKLKAECKINYTTSPSPLLSSLTQIWSCIPGVQLGGVVWDRMGIKTSLDLEGP